MQKADHVTISTPAQHHPMYYKYMTEFLQLLDILTAHAPVVRALHDCETSEGALARVHLLAQQDNGLASQTAASVTSKLQSGPVNNSNQRANRHDWCKTDNGPFKQCSACQQALYCSRAKPTTGSTLVRGSKGLIERSAKL